MTVATLLSAPATSLASLDSQLNELRSRLSGQLLTADRVGYDDARKTLYVTLDRYPLAIVRATNARDVAAAVDFARSNAIPLAVRSGGHSISHLSVIDDAIVVDLSGMKGVSIDPETRIARVQPGATSGDLAGPAHAHGLALTTGDTHSVGMGGLVTGGGIGFMARKYGLTIDSLLAAQVVTAAGEIVTASEMSHPDLFWAIRGGGGNVGIVTEFTFRLAPVGQILGGELMLPANREVLRGYLDYVTTAPDDLTTIANMWHAPPFPYVPEARVGEMVLSIYVCWTGSIAEGERALAPLRALAEPVADLVSPIPYPAIYDFTAFAAAPHAASIRTMFADDLSDASVDAVLAAMQHSSSPSSIVQFRGLGGAISRIAPDATAFAHRDRRYFVAIINVWLDATEDEKVHQAWTESLWDTIRHDGKGVYVNFLENEGADRVREAYPGATYERLGVIKRQYDPDNLFRFNQNVLPKA
ncbi:MAG: FAD-binding oxidoreductase [Chloroflexota bacterium]|nr:FAD-binding oxidoreductase [Chloroflexota bacterium]